MLVPKKHSLLIYLAICSQVGTSNTLAPLSKTSHSKYLSLSINWTECRTVLFKSGHQKCLIGIVASTANCLITIPKATVSIAFLLRRTIVQREHEKYKKNKVDYETDERKSK